MAFDKSEVMKWSNEAKRNLAFELLDSIDEEMIQQPLPKWKEDLIKQRMEKDATANDLVSWNELRKKYNR